MTIRTIRLSAWAKENGVSKMTAWRHAMAGTLPGARKSPLGHFVVDVPIPGPPTLTAIYARVSSHDQKGDIDRQIARVATYAAEQGIKVDRIVSEIGSGLNDKRKELGKLLADPQIGTIIVEHKDRLARFGVRHLQTVLGATGRKIIVVDSGEVKDDLVRDMIDLMACFSARLYGRRSAKNRAERALEALKP